MPAFYRDLAPALRASSRHEGADIPCGGSVAFRGLRAERHRQYVAADVSPLMLRRARAEADRRGIHWIEFVEADVQALPFEDSSFDLVLTYTGLHCFPDPPAAIAERGPGHCAGRRVARHLSDQAGGGPPGGARPRHAARWVFGPGQTFAELQTSLAGAGLVKVSTTRNGALAFFSADRRGGTAGRSA